MVPAISLLIVNHNSERYLREAMKSALTQTYTDFELLFWDDGSTDKSVEIAQAYALQDRRVRVIASAHQGVAAARQAAIAQTTGAYIAWIDSDDLLASTALEETSTILDASPDIGLVYTDYVEIDAEGNTKGYGQRCHIPYSKDLLLRYFMTFHFRLFRRSVFEQIGGINASCTYAYDYDLCLRMSEVTTIHHLKRPLYYYRRHGSAISYQKRREQTCDSYKAIFDALRRRKLIEQYVPLLANDDTRSEERSAQHTVPTYR